MKRLASEYQNTIASATGDSAKQSGPELPRREDEDHADETTTNTAASRAVIAPRGISRIAVRGFSAS